MPLSDASLTGTPVSPVGATPSGPAAPSESSFRTINRSLARGMDHSSIMAAELIAALVTWAGIGWLLDRWLGTGPWLLAIGALVGNAAGIYLIYVRSGRMEGFDGTPSTFGARTSTPATTPATGATTRDGSAPRGGRA